MVADVAPADAAAPAADGALAKTLRTAECACDDADVAAGAVV